jgi:hypothetical protein
LRRVYLTLIPAPVTREDDIFSDLQLAVLSETLRT